MNIIEALEIGESLCASEAEQVLAGEVRNCASNWRRSGSGWIGR